MKAMTKKRDNKFGLEIPRNVKRTLAIDWETGTDLWKKVNEKEMHHVSCPFNILDKGIPKPGMSKQIPCHMIFDIKTDFTRKARFVAGGHVTDPLQA